MVGQPQPCVLKMDVIFGSEGFYDAIAQPQPYDVLFEVDENGYIKSLEDDGNYQYYNPVSVEDGVIGTIQNDEGVDSVANNGINQVDQWFFTTPAPQPKNIIIPR